VQSALQEQARLRQAGWSPVTHNSQFGRRVPWDANTHTPFSGIAAVNQVRSTVGDPHTWIIELGTNDVGETHDDAESIRTVIQSMLAVIGPDHRIVWVNVHHGFEPAASATFNRVLGEIAAQRPDLVVADWAGVAETPGYLIADHIHLTPEGQVAYAALIAAAADQAALLP
jgi:lysophospholipase L1-like esterase